MFIKKMVSSLLMLFVLFFIILLLYPVGYFILGPGRPLPHASVTHPQGVISYIINLDRSKERYDYVKLNVSSLGFPSERITAVDGKELSESEINQAVNFPAYEGFMSHPPKHGTIGCSLSHIKAWNTFLDSNYKYAIIFEDDVNFDPLALRQAVDLLTQNVNYWDINTFEVTHTGIPLTLKKLNDDLRIVVYLAEVSHAGAYIITRDAAKKLLEKALPIKMPIDHYYTRTWEMGLKFTGVEPRLVHQKFGDSEIKVTKRTDNPIKDKIFSSFFYIAAYKMQTTIIRFAYNLKLYLRMKLEA